MKTGGGLTTGQASVTIAYSVTGTYSGCTIQITDHASNASNVLTIPNFEVITNPNLFVCYESSLTIPQSECFALVDFYESTRGTGWVSSTGWTTDPDVNNWHGINTVTLTGQQYVSEILLHRFDTTSTTDPSSSVRDNNLVGTIPGSLSGLTNLSIINLSYSDMLTGSLPSELGSLANLQEIIIRKAGVS